MANNKIDVNKIDANNKKTDANNKTENMIDAENNKIENKTEADSSTVASANGNGKNTKGYSKQIWIT
ncbi:hypothetical protein TSUD_100700 [Trifolium subterraneum]|uniref:Uncharacterized protein n=1 Tax=Trifolium subterraneum TaxID=3900 RepID=A0A2Z6NQP0_TRISU|nr:hypothetical protein TSUD_100700 [Trifolium subterraneum]